jgi:hypothetical protein
VPVPEAIVAVVHFGSTHPDAVRPSFWVHVQEEFEAFIESQVPEGAGDVRAILDEEHTEVVLSFRARSDADVQ